MFVQVIFTPLFILIRLAIVRTNLRRNSALNIKKDIRYIIYSNHQSKLDPFVICASFPLLLFPTLLPFRFFVKNSFFSNRIIKSLLIFFGGFPSHSVPHKSFGLEKARKLLNTNQTVVIFPQGGITKERIAKRGISLLAIEPNVHLIPVHVRWHGLLYCKVTIGSPFTTTIPQSPEAFMERVYKLDRGLGR